MKCDNKTFIWGLLSFVWILFYSVLPICEMLSDFDARPLMNPFVFLLLFVFLFPTLLSLLFLSWSSNQYNNYLFVLIWMIQASTPIALLFANYAEDANMSFRLLYTISLLCLVVILEFLLLLTKRRSLLRNMTVLGLNLFQLCIFLLPLEL